MSDMAQCTQNHEQRMYRVQNIPRDATEAQLMHCFENVLGHHCGTLLWPSVTSTRTWSLGCDTYLNRIVSSIYSRALWRMHVVRCCFCVVARRLIFEHIRISIFFCFVVTNAINLEYTYDCSHIYHISFERKHGIVAWIRHNIVCQKLRRVDNVAWPRVLCHFTDGCSRTQQCA